MNASGLHDHAHLSHRVGLERELDHDAKVTAATAKGLDKGKHRGSERRRVNTCAVVVRVVGEIGRRG